MLHATPHTQAYRPPPEPLRRPRQPHDIELATTIISDYYPNLTSEALERLTKRVIEHLDFLRSSFPLEGEVRGKRILDVACGSRSYPDNQDHLYDPWMLRLVTHLGADGFGVDLSPQIDERFGWLTADLLTPNALAPLPTAAFDALYICAFPTRKVLETMFTCGPSWEAVRTDILSHFARVLKPDGKIIRTFTSETEKWVEEKSAALRAPVVPQPTLPPRPERFDPRYFDEFDLD